MARILIVEDEALIAEFLGCMSKSWGTRSSALRATVEHALSLLNDGRPDCAILDCALGPQESTPVAEELAKAAVPFAFATGRGADSLPKDFKQRPMITKPYIFDDVERVLAGMIS